MSGVEVVKRQAKFDDSPGIQSWTAEEVTFDDSRIQWTESKSAKGATFLIGRPKDHHDGGPAAPSRLSREVANVAVNWPMGDDSWKDTTQYEKDTLFISRYKLHRYTGFWPFKHWPFKYIMYITNTQNLADIYRVEDDSGDSYVLTTFRPGDHYVRYNSGYPNINRVYVFNN